MILVGQYSKAGSTRHSVSLKVGTVSAVRAMSALAQTDTNSSHSTDSDSLWVTNSAHITDSAQLQRYAVSCGPALMRSLLSLGIKVTLLLDAPSRYNATKRRCQSR